MHEHHFIQNIIKDIPEKENIKGVEIELGELVGIEAHHLKEHLEEETGWKVTVKTQKSKVECSCGYTGEANILQRLHDMVIYDCPGCNGEPKVLHGKDLKILKVNYN